MDISDFKKGYQPRTNTMLAEMADLITESHSILATWRKHVSQLFNVNGVSDVRQREIHTAELTVQESSAFEFEMTVEKLKVTNNNNNIYLTAIGL